MSEDITKQDDKFDTPYDDYLVDTANVTITGSLDADELTNISGSKLTSGGIGTKLDMGKNGQIIISDENGVVRVIIGKISDD